MTLAAANFSLEGLASGESFTVTQTAGIYDSKDVPTATTVTAVLSASDFTPGTGTLASNYVLPTTASGAGSITPKTLTASLVGTLSKTYDGTTTAKLVAADFALVGLVGMESFTVTQTTGTYTSKNVTTATTVTATLSASDFSAAAGTLAADYTLPTSASGPGTITPATVSASIVGNPTKIYDGTDTATLAQANFKLAGVASGDSFIVTPTAATYNSQDVATATTIMASFGASNFTPGPGTLASNYVLPVTATGAGSIAPAPLFVTATSVSVVYGSALPALTDTITGFVAGEMSSVLSGSPLLTTSAKTGSRHRRLSDHRFSRYALCPQLRFPVSRLEKCDAHHRAGAPHDYRPVDVRICPRIPPLVFGRLQRIREWRHAGQPGSSAINHHHGDTDFPPWRLSHHARRRQLSQLPDYVRARHPRPRPCARNRR